MYEISSITNRDGNTLRVSVLKINAAVVVYIT